MPTMIQELGIDPQDYLKVGLLSMVPWGVAIVAMVLNGGHSDRKDERFWHAVIPALISAAGLLGLALVGHEPLASMIFLTMVTAGLLSLIAVFWSIPAGFLSGTAAAAGIAWINSVGCLGGFIGPDLIGRVRTATDSSELAFLMLTGMMVLGAITLVLMRHGLKPSTAR